MSSTYRRICLSHSPPLTIDEDWRPGDLGEAAAPPAPDGHPNCKIGVGRWSGALIELLLPRRDGTVKWYDVSWIHQPGLAGVLDLLATRDTPVSDPT